jgi:rare lipoprotein A
MTPPSRSYYRAIIAALILACCFLSFVVSSQTTEIKQGIADRHSLEADISANAETLSNLTDRLIYIEAAYSFIGTASFYGRESGKITANGERFDPNALTAASYFLPFNSVWRVTNIQDGRNVIVRINDRGPHVVGRIIDLSAGAARAIGMTRRGVVAVKLEPGL